MKVPFIDLHAQYMSIQPEVDTEVKDVLLQASYIGGHAVKGFEAQFAKALQINHCIGVGNGTDALYTILAALDLPAGAEVITPAMSWISSAETITQAGARVVFCDVDPVTYTLDPLRVAEKITDRTAAVVVVHLYGQSAPMAALAALCRQHTLHLIEDCAQAHFTRDGERYAGTWGDAAAFSFYPTKNLGAYGDAGCIVTRHETLAQRMRRLANHGALVKDDHLFEGFNSRLDALQAAILSVKLRHLPRWNARRIALSDLYKGLLQGVEEIVLPVVRPDTVHTYHIYAIRARHRDALKQYLEANGILTVVHYPVALPNLPAYHSLGHHPEDFPVSSRLQGEVLSLPIYPELTEEQVRYVCKNILDFYAKHGV
ncbi:DegT/DnrJ/EryC1/StrS family aminotransferase [Dawidia soli]|uniref:DegT/DnrJ/EryC1/StrS family aminotransferase n=1 Tax=Dawidia soli TaxID=2782352 RepID=A0AAP2GG36_9BACT|nr:DegT/DnrJ/EryC1/StrS family aminotransferase [Dawidia soli]MBT1690187.1 DegT/DnrJ/EryC1/StrS family aminotransferase [Dawidia soli]